MKLAERLGIMPPASLLSIEDMTPELRNKLWNLTYMFLKVQKEEKSLANLRESKLHGLKPKLWHSFFKQPIDKIPYTDTEVINYIRQFFIKGSGTIFMILLSLFLNILKNAVLPWKKFTKVTTLL